MVLIRWLFVFTIFFSKPIYADDLIYEPFLQEEDLIDEYDESEFLNNSPEPIKLFGDNFDVKFDQPFPGDDPQVHIEFKIKF